MSPGLEAQVRKLADIEDIKTLMARYCHGIDKKDEAGFMSIWAEDADYVLPRGHGTGTEGIRQLVQKVWREVPKCHHHITNPLIQIDGDHASAATDVFYYRLTADGVRVLLSGCYAFSFVRRAGRWLTRSLKFTSFDTVSPAFPENLQG